MATKLFKGRQKWKPGELSINSEQKLIELIHSNLDASQTEEEEDENLSTTELTTNTKAKLHLEEGNEGERKEELG